MTTIGIISDTHMPARWKTLHPVIFQIFADVDLVFHAGDVGELWVLDELSQFAPVIAVHGNDETVEATKALPYQQVVVTAGHRILLTHSHYPDHGVEMEQRKIDDWHPKLQRLADWARRDGCDIVVYGHTHIPMFVEYDGVWIINSGGIASGGYGVRQTVQTVARLRFQNNGAPSVVHYDLNNGAQPHLPTVDLDRGFKAAMADYSESIVAPDLAAHFDWLFRNIYPAAPEAVLEAVAPLSFRCWDGQANEINLKDVIVALWQAPDMPEAAKSRLAEVSAFAPYLE